MTRDFTDRMTRKIPHISAGCKGVWNVLRPETGGEGNHKASLNICKSTKCCSAAKNMTPGLAPVPFRNSGSKHKLGRLYQLRNILRILLSPRILVSTLISFGVLDRQKCTRLGDWPSGSHH